MHQKSLKALFHTPLHFIIMAPLIYSASQVTQRMTWIILLILISPNNVGFVYDRVGLRLTIYCLCFLKSKHPLFWDEILELVLGQHLLCRTTKRNIFFHDGICKQHNNNFCSNYYFPFQNA